MREYYQELIAQLTKILSRVEPKEEERFVELIRRSRRVYLVGAGRSGLIARIFAMRLVHLRRRCYVVGETVVPAFRHQDCLVAVSGSGRTRSVVEIARTARRIGGRVVAVTAHRSSPLARVANELVLIPARYRARRAPISSYNSRQLIGQIAPLGSLFELSAFLFFEGVVSQLMEELKVTEAEMRREHTLLE
jgi:6-phospho 3-hexuloisomerase